MRGKGRNVKKCASNIILGNQKKKKVVNILIIFQILYSYVTLSAKYSKVSD